MIRDKYWRALFSNPIEKPITKEQYDRAQLNNGFIPTEDMDKIFTTAEICGYGVYGTTVYKDDHDGYYVSFWLGSTCD